MLLLDQAAQQGDLLHTLLNILYTALAVFFGQKAHQITGGNDK